MHPQSPPFTIGIPVLQESDDLVTLGVTINSKMPFGDHLRLVFRAASQRVIILNTSIRVFHS